jgi:hypothetical protein
MPVNSKSGTSEATMSAWEASLEEPQLVVTARRGFDEDEEEEKFEGGFDFEEDEDDDEENEDEDFEDEEEDFEDDELETVEEFVPEEELDEE